MIKKDEDSRHDFSSLNKYFIDDSKIDKKVLPKQKIITEDVSISESSFGNYESSEETETPKTHQKIEKKGCPDKIKFLKSIEENDSLTLDTCASVNKDWNRK